MRKFYWAGGAGLGVMTMIFYIVILGAPQAQAEPEWLTVPLETGGMETLKQWRESGFIKSELGLLLALMLRGKNPGKIEPGGYQLTKAMNAWRVAGVLAEGPGRKWVVIPEGWRKEQIAALLKETLGWSETEEERWIREETELSLDQTEGVYWPDTYLIPVEEEPARVAERLRARFNEKFEPFLKEALRQNIKWTTLIKLASIVEREGLDETDRPLIAGILWNRLLAGEKLEVDATLQYIKGNKENGWWPAVRPEDKRIDSPFNTYKYKGLPPRPIANPGETAIRAVLNPEETDCWFYLHDDSGKIYCARTYEEHQENIERYLK